MPPASARRVKQYYMAVGMTTLNLVPYVPEVGYRIYLLRSISMYTLQQRSSDRFIGL
jgi:hypothetical protein